MVYNKTNFCFAHTGNTRLYLIRSNSDGVPNIKQLTTDNTKAFQLLNDGQITLEQYYTHPDRLVLTNCIGISPEMPVQVFKGNLKPADLLVLTTDGIHYAIRQQSMCDIIMQTGEWDTATKSLIMGAKSQQYADNMSAMIIYLNRL